MKKTFYYIAAIVLAFGLASCTKDETKERPITTEGTRQISVWAQINDDATTKTALSGNDAEGYTVLWSEGDEIIVADGWNSKFTLVEGAGTTQGRFVGTSQEGDGTYHVFYAAGVATNYKTLYSTSQYNGDKVITSAPMTATITISNGEATTTDFKNLCGLLRLTLKGSGTVSEIKIYADQALYGRFEIESDGSAIITSSPYLDYITQRSENGVPLSSIGTDFYISMPPNDYTGVKIEVSDFDGHTFTKTLKADKTLNIARAQITPAVLTVTGLTNDNVPLTKDSPIGAIGPIDGREGMVVDLDGTYGKVVIATRNVDSSTPTKEASSATAAGSRYNFYDAQSVLGTSGWYVPSKDEWKALVEIQNSRVGSCQEWVIGTGENQHKLYLNWAGSTTYVRGIPEEVPGLAYWSSTSKNSVQAYYLGDYTSSTVNSAYIGAKDGLRSVRPFHKLN